MAKVSIIILDSFRHLDVQNRFGGYWAFWTFWTVLNMQNQTLVSPTYESARPTRLQQWPEPRGEIGTLKRHPSRPPSEYRDKSASPCGSGTDSRSEIPPGSSSPPQRHVLLVLLRTLSCSESSPPCDPHPSPGGGTPSP